MRPLLVSVLSVSCLVPAIAMASGPDDREDGTWDTRIFGGENVDFCAWPTTVAVRNGGSLCTGTLVHPQVVMYAAHCGASATQIVFGERSGGGNGQTVSCQSSRTNPGYSGSAGDQANDWAYCLLPEPVSVPITPIVFGCETSATQPGAQIAVVGFGCDTPGATPTQCSGSGTKRWALTTLTGWSEQQNVATVGGGGQPSVCSGDSGGPAFVQFPDGSWHAFGIASTVTGGCGGVGTHSLMQGAIPWVEGDLGVDLTPCHDADGTWNPGPECKGFFSGDPATGVGSWGNWCQGTPFNNASDTCDAPFMPDDTPPTVEITNPADGSRIELADAVDIAISATDAWGSVREVHLLINGADIGVTDFTDPYGFNGATFPAEGVYELVATAEDWNGMVGTSETVVIGVGVDPPPPGTSGTAGEEGTGGEGIDPGLDDAGGGTGCGCSTDSNGAPGGMLLMGVAFFLRRRRR